MKVEIYAKDKQYTVVYEKSKEDFLDMFSYDKGDMYVETENGFYIMVKTIEAFRFIQ
jgi:hypothetical protein